MGAYYQEPGGSFLTPASQILGNLNSKVESHEYIAIISKQTDK